MNTLVASENDIQWSAYIGIFLGLFCGYLSLASVIPVLPDYVRERFAANDILVGLTVMATALTAVFARPLAGGIADRAGYKQVMQTGAVLLAIAGLLYTLEPNLPGLILSRCLGGIGEAALFTAGAAWAVSLSPANRKGQVIGLYGVSMWGGISAGATLGALLMQRGYQDVWWFSAALPVLGLLSISLVPAPAARQETSKGYRYRLLVKPAVLPGLGLALAAGGYAVLAAFGVLHLKARGIESGVAVLSVFSAVYAGTRIFIGNFPDRFGPRIVAMWSGAGEAVGLLIIAFAPSLPIALIGGVVMGVGFSLLHPSLALMVVNRTDRAEQGAALGAYTSFWDLGLGVWGPAMGVVSTALGLTTAFIFGAVAALLAVGAALLVDLNSPNTAAFASNR
jgi:MFS family permease